MHLHTRYSRSEVTLASETMVTCMSMHVKSTTTEVEQRRGQVRTVTKEVLLTKAGAMYRSYRQVLQKHTVSLLDTPLI